MCEQQASRAALLERETGLQRWAVKLELESARQAAAARSLLQQLQKVMHLLASCMLLSLCVHARRLSCQNGYSCQVPAATLEDEAAPVISSVLHLQVLSCWQQLHGQSVQALGSSSRYKEGRTGTSEVKA